MSYTNHETVISNALLGLLGGEFDIDVVLSSKFEPKYLRNEYIRAWCEGRTFNELNTEGESRDYNFGIYYYFNIRNITQKIMDDTVHPILERVKQLLEENMTYQTGGYKWHGLAIDDIEFLYDEDENNVNNHYLRFDVRLTRFNQWA